MVYVVNLSGVFAQESVEDLQRKIETSQEELEKINKEIKALEGQLTQVGAEKDTLKNAIKKLDLSRQKLQKEINATQQRISSTNLEIQELEREIHVKELEVAKNTDAIIRSFQNIDQLESQTLFELVLGYDSLTEVWDVIEEQALLQNSIREDTKILTALKKEYEQAKTNTEVKLQKLATLKNELVGDNRAVVGALEEKDKLLDQTANEEANYQRVLAQKKAAREAFEKAIADYESQIKFILDPTTIPAIGSGVLRWPVDASFMENCPSRKSAYGNDYCITQYFGNTAFAQSGAYNGKGHNGIDFGIPTGTKVLATLGGTVIETGNTDAVPGCLSYGKWILIEHGNGLSSLYGHLSSVNVSTGQTVSTGQLIGHSGNTGYSTGPHLHFTVFASKGVQVVRLGDVKSITSCGAARVPVAGFEAYINPIDYL
jgi:murein DD-endopeptidase MepM/ murein hydrolase activator NlpD